MTPCTGSLAGAPGCGHCGRCRAELRELARVARYSSNPSPVRHLGGIVARVCDALLDECDRLSGEVAAYKRCYDLWNKGMESTCEDRDRLKQRTRELEAENAALRRERDELRRFHDTVAECERIDRGGTQG